MTSKSPGFKLLGPYPDNEGFTVRLVSPDLSIQQIKGVTMEELAELRSILTYVFEHHDKEN